MRKQLTSLLLLLTVLTSAYMFLNSANPLSTVTKTFTSTYTSSVTKSSTVSTIYETYVQTESYEPEPYIFMDQGIRLMYWFRLRAGDTIRIEVRDAKGCSGYIRMEYENGPSVGQFDINSNEYKEMTFQMKKDGNYLVMFYYTSRDIHFQITTYGTRTYTVTRSSFMLEQYVTNSLTEVVYREIEILPDSYESSVTITIIAIVAVAAVVVLVAFVKRKTKPKPEQTQLEKFASSKFLPDN